MVHSEFQLVPIIMSCIIIIYTVMSEIRDDLLVKTTIYIQWVQCCTTNDKNQVVSINLIMKCISRNGSAQSVVQAKMAIRRY